MDAGSRMLHLVRLVWRLLGTRLGLRLLPGWLVLAFVGSQLYDQFDWAGLSAALSGRPPVEAGATAGALIGAWALLWGSTLRATALSPELAPLWRQPVPDRAWTVAIAPIIGLVGAPLAVCSLLWASPNPGAQALLWLGSWLVPGLAVAAGGPRGLGLAAAGLVLGGALIGAGRAWPTWTPALVALAWAGALPTVSRTYHRLRQPSARRRRRLPWRPRTALGAVLRRDLLCLWRRERGTVLMCLVPPVPVAAVVLALRFRAHTVDPAAATLVLLAASAPLSAHLLGRLAARLGRRLDPPEWPVAPWLRSLGLVIVGWLALAPAWAGSMAGHASSWPSQIGLWAALGAGAAWAVAGGRVNLGAYLWWILAALAVVLAPLGPVLGVGLAGIGAAAAKVRLTRRRGRLG